MFLEKIDDLLSRSRELIPSTGKAAHKFTTSTSISIILRKVPKIHIRDHDFGKLLRNARRMRLSIHVPVSIRVTTYVS